MHEIRIKIFFWLAFWLNNNLLALSAAPEQGKDLDFGIYKIGLDVENGLKLKHEVNIDTPLFKLRRTGEIGFGDPVVTATDSDSEEDSVGVQSSRTKRAASVDKSTQYGNLIRRKRAPCFGVYGTTASPAGGGAAGGEEVVEGGEDEARRRRASRIMQKAQKNRAKKTKRSGRRRRQAELDSTRGDLKNVEKNFANEINGTLLNVRKFVDSVMQTTAQFMQNVKKAFDSTKNDFQNFTKE